MASPPRRRINHKANIRSKVIAALREFYKEYEPLTKSEKLISGIMERRTLQAHAEHIINTILAQDDAYENY